MGVFPIKSWAQLDEENDALRARVAELEAEFRHILGIGKADEWECAHGVKVSQTCRNNCHLNQTRRVLGFIK